MKKILFLFFFIHIINAQEFITLKYDNTGIDYKQPEIKIDYSNDKYRFQNTSIPQLQVILPDDSSKPTTAMIIAPGGGLSSNWIFHEGFDVANALNERGIAAFVLKYRLLPLHLIDKNEGLEPFFNEKKQLSYSHLDALSAIAHVRENAEKYNIDPNKIGIMGFSAGGAVAIEATYKSDEKNRPDFLAPIYPWMLVVEEQEPPSYGPPLFIACTTEDDLELAIPSAKLYIDWAEKGFISEIHNYHHGDHGYGMNKTGYPIDNWFNNMIDWIQAIGMLN